MSDARFFDYGRTFVPPVTLTPERTALVVIDMQYHDASPDNGFNLALDKIDPGCLRYFNDRVENVVIPAVAGLLAFFRSTSMRVIYVTLGSEHRDLRDVPDRLREWIRSVESESGVPDIFWAGSPAAAIREEIRPKPGDLIVNKTTFGAFNGSDIDAVLRDLDVESLVLTGVSTNCCVETTARDAADRGYGCVIVADGTADYDEHAHDAALRAFHFNFGRAASAAEVIRAIEGGQRL
jgi:biuret amidohydrolase